MALLFGLLAAGCAQMGESGVQGELDRVRATKGVAVLSAEPQRAVVAARGKRVVVEPAEGACIAPDSVDVSRRVAFLVVSDCAIEDEGEQLASVEGTAIAVELPPAFPGVVTVSVSDVPMEAERAENESPVGALRRYLESSKGRRELGRSGDDDTVEIEESRIVGNTLYVLVNDSDEETLNLLSPRFWRAFVEVNERMVVATVSGFRDRPVDPDQMLRKLTSQVSALRAANGTDAARAVEDERPALSPPRRRDARDAEETGPGAGEGAPSEAPGAIAPRGRDEDALEPVTIEEIDAGEEGGEDVLEAGPNAPEEAPAAPRRRLAGA